LLIEERPSPLNARPHTQQERDHLEAVSLFSAGRMHERRGELADALRCYERALRLDPQAGAILRAIIPVAVRLERHAEAVRYATKIVELEDSDPLLLRLLGVHLTEQGDLAGAARLYAKSLAARDDRKKTATDILLHMEMGRICHLAEKYAEAADNFAKVVRALEHPEEVPFDDEVKRILLGEPGPTYVLFGDCFLAAGRTDEAMAAFKKAESLDPNPARMQLNLARVCAKTNKPTEALAALETCFAAHVRDQGETPYATLADVLKQLGKSDELIPRLEKLHADEADNAPLAYFLASQYRTAGDDQKAEALYLALLDRAAAPMAYGSLIEIYRQGKRYDALLAILGRTMDSMDILDALQIESQSVSGDADALENVLQAARTLYKAEPERCTQGMRQAAALLALEAKRYSDAAEFFELALATKPTNAAELALTWAVGLLTDDHAADAVKIFQRGIDENLLPADNPAFHFWLAGALALSDRTDDALAAARKAAELQPKSARMQERPAWVLNFAKRYTEAKKAYEELIQAFDTEDNSPDTRTVLRQARLILSNICVLENHLPQAEEWLEEVLDEFPDDVGAMNDLGYLWADQNKNLSRARAMIQKAVDAEPENAAYRDSLGWVLFRLGELPQAVDELEKAAADKKVDGTVLDHLGDAYQKTNQPEKAVDAWRRAAEALRNAKEPEKAEIVEKKIPK
jgi:tetratricopeptide (TPR) repeat protein